MPDEEPVSLSALDRRLSTLDIVNIYPFTDAYDMGRAARLVGIPFNIFPLCGGETQENSWKQGWISKDKELGERLQS